VSTTRQGHEALPALGDVPLPAVGIRGNTHFTFSDLNNLQIADLLSALLRKKELD